MNTCLKAADLTLLREEKTVVSGLTFAAAPGERIAILGANGSGKTTLARTILGFAPYRGVLQVEGREVGENPRAARKSAAAVFADADTQLLMPTVYDELAFSLKAAGSPADPAGVRIFAESFGLGFLLDRSPSDLSSGEKRKVLLAQSIGRQPALLILDEPTSDLDARGSRLLLESLGGLPQTIVLITHRYELALSLCRKAVVLGGGTSDTFADVRTLFNDRAALERWNLI